MACLVLSCGKSSESGAPASQEKLTVHDADRADEVINVLLIHESLVKSVWSQAEPKIREGVTEFEIIGPEGCQAGFIKQKNEDQVDGVVGVGEVRYLVAGCIMGVITLKVEGTEIKSAVFHPWRLGQTKMDTTINLK